MRNPLFHTALLALVLAACSDRGAVDVAAPQAHRARAFADVIRLPDGFWPEGITFGRGPTFYVGSLATGAIYRANALTGAGEMLVPAQDGLEMVGMRYDAAFDRLYVAGSFSGLALVYDATTGALLASYPLGQAGASLINDLVLLNDGVYFTDSFNDVIYRLPRDPGGRLPAADAASAIDLTGDWESVDSPIGNANGIAASPDGDHLIVINTTTGQLYRIERASGAAVRIEIDNGSLEGGDGILLMGRTLYVVQGHLNQIAVVNLSADLSHGTITGALTHDGLMFPSTIAQFGTALYAVNARFDVMPEDTTFYSVVRVTR